MLLGTANSRSIENGGEPCLLYRLRRNPGSGRRTWKRRLATFLANLAQWNGEGLLLVRREKFTMGSQAYEDAQPVPVELSQGFWIAKYELTRCEYRSIRGQDPIAAAFGPTAMLR